MTDFQSIAAAAVDRNDLLRARLLDAAVDRNDAAIDGPLGPAWHVGDHRRALDWHQPVANADLLLGFLDHEGRHFAALDQARRAEVKRLVRNWTLPHRVVRVLQRLGGTEQVVVLGSLVADAARIRLVATTEVDAAFSGADDARIASPLIGGDHPRLR